MRRTQEHSFEIDGRIVKCYVTSGILDRFLGDVFWTMRIGRCDVGTDVRFTADVGWDAVQRDLESWYRRKGGAAGFPHCWELNEADASERAP